jgi:hypothetical protein
MLDIVVPSMQKAHRQQCDMAQITSERLVMVLEASAFLVIVCASPSKGISPEDVIA